VKGHGSRPRSGPVQFCKRSAVNPNSCARSGHRGIGGVVVICRRTVSELVNGDFLTSERRGFVTRLPALTTALVCPRPMRCSILGHPPQQQSRRSATAIPKIPRLVLSIVLLHLPTLHYRLTLEALPGIAKQDIWIWGPISASPLGMYLYACQSRLYTEALCHELSSLIQSQLGWRHGDTSHGKWFVSDWGSHSYSLWRGSRAFKWSRTHSGQAAE